MATTEKLSDAEVRFSVGNVRHSIGTLRYELERLRSHAIATKSPPEHVAALAGMLSHVRMMVAESVNVLDGLDRK